MFYKVLVQMTFKRLGIAIIVVFLSLVSNSDAAFARVLGAAIRGTECDQRIQTKVPFTGIVESVRNPSQNLICHSFFHGLQCSHQKEPIRLPNDRDGKTRKRCRESFLKSHLTTNDNHQNHYEIESDKGIDRHCRELFSFEDFKSGLPNVVISYNSGEKGGSSFRALSGFKTDYGTTAAIPDGFCHFKYNSTGVIKENLKSLQQEFNCSYTFRQKDDIVQIFYDRFKNDLEEKDVGQWDICIDDWVEVYVLENNTEKSLSRFCRSTGQGAIISLEKSEVVKVVLSCGVEEVYSFFNARFLHFSSSFDVSGSDSLRTILNYNSIQFVFTILFAILNLNSC